jgi:3(or 17)beta-hydroxysteroid dehydrogenase
LFIYELFDVFTFICLLRRRMAGCNALLPAAILTPIWDSTLGKEEGERQKVIAALAEGIPLERMGNPMDVAYAALYFASDESRYVTGSE